LIEHTLHVEMLPVVLFEQSDVLFLINNRDLTHMHTEMHVHKAIVLHADAAEWE